MVCELRMCLITTSTIHNSSGPVNVVTMCFGKANLENSASSNSS